MNTDRMHLFVPATGDNLTLSSRPSPGSDVELEKS